MYLSSLIVFIKGHDYTIVLHNSTKNHYLLGGGGGELQRGLPPMIRCFSVLRSRLYLKFTVKSNSKNSIRCKDMIIIIPIIIICYVAE